MLSNAKHLIIAMQDEILRCLFAPLKSFGSE